MGFLPLQVDSQRRMSRPRVSGRVMGYSATIRQFLGQEKLS
jgi:hypothetical protein